MKRICLYLFTAVSLLSALGGCAPGLLYTDAIYPLDTNMTETPVGAKSSPVGLDRIVEPITGLGISVEVGDTSIGEAYKRIALKKANFADIRKEFYLFGLFQRDTVIVNGD